MSPDARASEVLKLLLEHFGERKHIEARTITKSRSTALQAAIVGHKIPAVNALLKAGADPSIVDPSGQSTLDLAIRGLHDVLIRETKLSKRDIKYDAARSLEIIFLISEAGAWPKQFNWGTSIKQMLKVAKPPIARMMDIPHWRAMSRGLEKELGEVIAENVRLHQRTWLVLKTSVGRFITLCSPCLLPNCLSACRPLRKCHSRQWASEQRSSMTKS